MANVFLAAVLLSGILAVSGCGMPLPGSGAYGDGGGGYGGGGYPFYGGTQGYPVAPGIAEVYAQPVQPYYQPQPYAYSGTTEVYTSQPDQAVPQATGGYGAAPSGRWLDRRQHRQEERFRQGRASGQLTPPEARRLQHEQRRIQGAEGRMQADGNLGPRERARLNGMQQRGSQDIYRQRHNGVQAGPTAQQTRPTGTAPPMAQVRPAAQPKIAAAPRAAAQRQTAAPPRAAVQPRATGTRATRTNVNAP
jgi:hypothetical protein